MNSEKRQIWGLRGLSLGLAIALWFVLSFEQREARSEKFVEASISYIRAERTVILDPVQQVQVNLSGPQDAVNNVTARDVGVQVDLRESPVGNVKINLTPDNVVNLAQGLKVERIRPSVLELTLDQQGTRRLTVEPQIVGEPAAGAMIGDVTVRPEQVTVTGPESQLSSLESVQTTPISLDGHAISFEEMATIVLPDILSVSDIEPPRVNVRIPLQVSAPPENGPNGPPSGSPGQ